MNRSTAELHVAEEAPAHWSRSTYIFQLHETFHNLKGSDRLTELSE